MQNRSISQLFVLFVIIAIVSSVVFGRELLSIQDGTLNAQSQTKIHHLLQNVAFQASASTSSFHASTTSTSSCVVTDVSELSSAASSCTSLVIQDVLVPAGETLDLTSIQDNSVISFAGNTSFGYKQWSGPLISVAGTNITLVGEAGHVIDGQGAQWWDGKGSNGGKTKPKFFAAHKLINSTISNLNVLNTPVQAFSINACTNLIVSDIIMNNTDGDVNNIGHNTDAFDVGSSTNVSIVYSWVHNQDDCLAVNSVDGLLFQHNYCYGGHGASIGSVGLRSNNVVENVLIDDVQIVDSQNGVRVKTVYNATGSVNNITYSNIVLTNITRYGVVIEGDYENGSPTGSPTGGVPITNLTLTNVTGTVTSGGTNLYILVQNASDWSFVDVDVVGGTKPNNYTGMPDNTIQEESSSSSSSSSGSSSDSGSSDSGSSDSGSSDSGSSDSGSSGSGSSDSGSSDSGSSDSGSSDSGSSDSGSSDSGSSDSGSSDSGSSDNGESDSGSSDGSESDSGSSGGSNSTDSGSNNSSSSSNSSSSEDSSDDGDGEPGSAAIPFFSSSICVIVVTLCVFFFP